MRDRRLMIARARAIGGHVDGRSLNGTSKSMGMGSYGGESYLGSLLASRLPAGVRARDPFGNHVWVFIAAMAIAIAGGQVPFKAMSETAAEMEIRARLLRKSGRTWIPRHGKDRRAVLRHIRAPLHKRMSREGLEENSEHPLAAVLGSPNPHISGNQLMQLTIAWLAVRGEGFWALTNAEGMPITPGELPAQIWPLGPDCFHPIFSGFVQGDLTHWRFAVPHYMELRNKASFVDLSLDQVVQFKVPNPANPIRGISRIAAAAAGIESDLMARDYNRAVLENRGSPGGLLKSQVVLTPEKETELLERWEQRHKGPNAANRPAVVSGGIDWESIALSHEDMQLLETMKWNRDETLAAMGASAGNVGISDADTYATALVSDNRFWTRTLIPLLELIETTCDGTLMYAEPDTSVLCFDLSQVEALRLAMLEKLESARKLAGQELHMPPKTAFQVLGMEIPSYSGDDASFVPPLLSTAEVVARDAKIAPLDPALALATPPGQPGAQPPKPGANGTLTVATPTTPSSPATPRPQLEVARLELVQATKAKAKLFERDLFDPIERPFRASYKTWIAGELVEHLRTFDAAVKAAKALHHKANPDLTAIFPQLKSTQSRLSKATRSIYAKALNLTFEFTVDETGMVPTFEIDDPSIMGFFDRRMDRFVDTVPKTLRKNLSASLTKAISNGETIQEMRTRIGEVFKVASGEAKVLMVARTETGGFVNGVRQEMFAAQGFAKLLWTTASDEGVRADHEVFGAAGPQALNFNFLQLVGGGGGSLRYPGDTEGPAGQTINCRCSLVPTE